MGDISRDITSVLLGVVGVATLAVLFVKSNQTANVIQSASSGFANILGVAMGGGPNQSSHLGGYF